MPTDRAKLEETAFGRFLAGLGALGAVWPAPSTPLRYPHRNEADALRGDGLRLGDDMRRVIERETLGAQAAAE